MTLLKQTSQMPISMSSAKPFFACQYRLYKVTNGSLVSSLAYDLVNDAIVELLYFKMISFIRV